MNENTVEIVENPTEVKSTKTSSKSNTKNCKILAVNKDGSITVNFSDYGLIIKPKKSDTKYKVGETVKVKYFGEIGNPDFKYEV